MAQDFETDQSSPVPRDTKQESLPEATLLPEAGKAQASVDDAALKRDQTRAAEFDREEEERRRAGRGGGGNPANASHSLNIRPDVVEGPAGLEVRTSMKSADYRANPDFNADLAEAERSAREEEQRTFHARSGEPERGANQQTLTLEAIERDPWNAVELPLPANAGADLLHAARSAAEYCAAGEHELMLAAHEGRYTPPGWTGAEGEPDVHEYNEAKWFQADQRVELIDDQLDKLEGRGPHDASAESARDYMADRLARSDQDLGEEVLTPDQMRQRDMAILRDPDAPDEARGQAFLGRLLYRYEETLGTPIGERIEDLRTGILTSYDMPRGFPAEPFLAAVGADIRQGTGFTQWPETHELLGDLLNEMLTPDQMRQHHNIDESVKRDASPDSANGYFADYPQRADESDGGDAQRDQVTQRGNEESTKRQDAERADRSGEDVPGDLASSVTPSLAADLRAAEKAAKIEREAGGRELVTHDHGEAKAPGGGGGRGIF